MTTPRMRAHAVTLRAERNLLRGLQAARPGGRPLLAGMDEVGRGSLAGPVSVGVVIVCLDTPSAPAGVRDSKELSAGAREALVEPIRSWAQGWAVGHATAAEIDDSGIIAALRLAGRRALAQAEAAAGGEVGVVLLDGSHDWLSSAGQGSLFEEEWSAPAVSTRVKADQTCASVAAASVLAKVERDQLMTELAASHPGYGWAANKGYASAEHVAGLSRLGPSAEHRTSWSLPGVG